LLIVLAPILDRCMAWLLLEREQTGFLQLCRLTLVAKYAYFNMSIGVLCGVSAGIQIKRHCRRPVLVRDLLAIGTAITLFGIGWLRLETGNLSGLAMGEDMRLWRWTFYSGCLLVTLGLILLSLKHFETLSRRVQEAFKWAGILGQCTLPVVVLHGLVMTIKRILVTLGVPSSIGLALPLVLFFLAIGIAARRIYRLYYGSSVHRSVAHLT
jgi:hypothetical protein